MGGRSKPWDCGKSGGEITCCDGELLVAVARFRDDAEEIVRAVNAFEPMREALKIARNRLEDIASGSGFVVSNSIAKIDAALALADKEQP